MTTRDEQRRDRRARMEESLKRTRDEQRRRVLMSRVKLFGLAGLGLLLVAFVVFYAFREATAPLPGEPVPDEGRTHVEPGTPITYKSYPPASGTHYGTTAPYRFHDTPVEPGFWIHNLEHGGIVILYNCPEDCPALKNQLRGLYNKATPSSAFRQVKLTIVPDTKIPSRLAVLSWDRKLELQDYDEGTILRYYDASLDRGPEKAP